MIESGFDETNERKVVTYNVILLIKEILDSHCQYVKTNFRFSLKTGEVRGRIVNPWDYNIWIGPWIAPIMLSFQQTSIRSSQNSVDPATHVHPVPLKEWGN